MKYFILVIFISISASAAQKNIEKQFSCGHGGLGNAEVEATFNFNDNVFNLKSIYLNERSNPPDISRSQVYVSSFKITEKKIYFSGVVPDQENILVDLNIDYDSANDEVNGTFKLNESSYDVSKGHCNFTNF